MNLFLNQKQQLCQFKNRDHLNSRTCYRLFLVRYFQCQKLKKLISTQQSACRLCCVFFTGGVEHLATTTQLPLQSNRAHQVHFFTAVKLQQPGVNLSLFYLPRKSKQCLAHNCLYSQVLASPQSSPAEALPVVRYKASCKIAPTRELSL